MDRTTAMRALIGAALIGLVAQAWLFRTVLGVNVVLLTAAVLAAGWSSRGSPAAPTDSIGPTPGCPSGPSSSPA